MKKAAVGSCLALLFAVSLTLAFSQRLAAAPITFVGTESTSGSLMEYIAIEKGIFSKHGLDVKFVGATSGQQMASALIGGSAQFGLLTMTASAPLIRQGQCLQYLISGPRVYYNIIARPDVPLPNADKPFPANLVDLKGKKIGIIARGTVMESMMNVFFAEAGISPNDVTYIATGGTPTAVAAFRNGQIDAAMTFPVQEQILQPNEFKYVAKVMDIKNRNPFFNVAQTFSGTTCAYAKEHPEVVAAYCSAMGDAYRYANDPANKNAVIELVSKSQKLDLKTAGEFWQQYGMIWPSPAIEENAWDTQKLYLQSGEQLPKYSDHVSSACRAKL